MLLANIERKPIDWLWKPFVQNRAINLLTGDPSAGKSTIVCELAAAFSSGRPLPGLDPAPRPPLNTWIMNGEDGAEDTIAWRLYNQGADPTRIWVTDQALAIDLGAAREMRSHIIEKNIGFLVIDPIQAWVGAGMDMNRANETRAWGEMLRSIAVDTGCAVMFVRHRRKTAPGASDSNIQAGLGSIDITGLARSEVSAIVGKDQTTTLVRSKGNVGKKGSSIGYVIIPSDEPGNDHGILKWVGVVEQPKAGATIRVPKMLAFAINFLTELLRDGPVSAPIVFAEAAKRGVSERTLRRAKSEVAESAQDGEGKWVWFLKGEVADGVV